MFTDIRRKLARWIAGDRMERQVRDALMLLESRECEITRLRQQLFDSELELIRVRDQRDYARRSALILRERANH
ncbi:MAG: hypothetical protein ACI4OZ_05150 [Akkermansia sp.]